MALENTNFSINKIDTIFKNAKSVFFIGIGGLGVSSLAKFCLNEGKEVFGYDCKRTKITEELEKRCHIKYYSSPDSVLKTDLVIFTTAVNEKNHEYSMAKRLNIPVISRANFLGYVMSNFKHKIGVCGMHGKTTVTSMLHHIFKNAMKEPTTFCGGNMKHYGNEVFGKNDYFIFEACEYLDAFLCFCPNESIITNIDFDHPDYFKSREQIVNSFQHYANLNEKIYVNNDDELSKRISHPSKISFALSENADYVAKIIPSDKFTEFSVYTKNMLLTSCKIKLYGEHFVYDALCAFAVAYENGIDKDIIKNALFTFEGASRRMDFIKKTDTGIDIFQDYAHHPTEIKATLKGLRAMGYKKITCIFQAHTFSRTYYLYDEFKDCFSDASNLIILPTFSAREENVYSFTDSDFASHCGGVFIDNYQKAVDYVITLDEDVIIIMGAGNINDIGKFF